MKKLLIFALTLAFAYVLCVPVIAEAATELTVENVDDAIALNYGIENIIVLRDCNGDLFLPIELDSRYYMSGPYDEQQYSANSWNVTYYDGGYVLTSPSWWHCALFQLVNGEWVQVQDRFYNNCIDDFEMVYASKTMYYRSSSYGSDNLSGTIFFRVTPIPLTELAVIWAKSNRQMNLMCLVISLLPSVISLVVSLLALRKCLQALRTILHGA